MEPISTDTKIDDPLKATKAIRGCIPILEKIADKSELLSLLPEVERIALITAAGKISRPDKKEIKKRSKDRKRQKRAAIVEKERRLRAATGIRKAREAEIFLAPHQICGPKYETGNQAHRLKTPRNCYVCKAEFTQLHHFYDTISPHTVHQNQFLSANIRQY